jgi:hypothetical protein
MITALALMLVRAFRELFWKAAEVVPWKKPGGPFKFYLGRGARLNLSWFQPHQTEAEIIRNRFSITDMHKTVMCSLEC